MNALFLSECAALLSLSFAATIATASSSVVNSTCGPWTSPEVLCINRYASLMQGPFVRIVKTELGAEDTFPSTSIADDPSFRQVANATFLVYDADRAAGILGDSPTYEVMFTTPPVNHEGPVYVPELNYLYVAQVGTDILENILIDLNQSPPTLEYFLADPPLYAPTGSVYRDGLIYHGCSGGNSTSELFAHPGIYTFDPKTNQSAALLNNYFGWYFNSADDLTMHSNGDIWFTDDYYGWLDKTDDTNPQIGSATYRFRPSTGVVQIVESQLNQPNGIGFSPDESILYITDTGAGNGPIDNSFDDITFTDTPTGPRTVYQFDVINDGTQIINGRPIYLSQDGAPDGFKVAANGYLVTATGHGVDILDPNGLPLARIQTAFPATNIAFAGANLTELWIVGAGAIARVQWALAG